VEEIIMRKKIFSMRNILVISLVMMFAFASFAFAAGAIAQTSSLAGTVVAEGLVAPGTMVSEGQILVKVKTIAGTAAAARANCSGKVVSVSVSPGNSIVAGQVVANVQP
jgi:biotin carboxyl carrier protein